VSCGEQGILNDEVRRAEIRRTGNQGAGYQDSRVSGNKGKNRGRRTEKAGILNIEQGISNDEGWTTQGFSIDYW